MSSTYKRLLLAVSLLSALIIIVILTDVVPWLRGPAPETSEWYWPYLLRPLSRWWAPLLAAVAMWLVGVWWLSRSPEQSNRLPLLALMLAHVLLQLAIIYADRPDVFAELVDRTISQQSGGFFMPAAEVGDMDELLAEYAAAMPTFDSEHARTHPPGLLLANWGTIRLMEKPPDVSEWLAAKAWPQRCIDLWLLNRPPAVAAALGIWALLPLLAGAITVGLAYLLARAWLPAEAARLAALLAAALPALLLFAPKVIQLYGALALLVLWLLSRGIQTERLRWFYLSGLALSLATFLSLNNAPLLLPVTTMTIAATWTQRPWRQQWGRWLGWGVTFGAGLVTVWLLAWMQWGTEPLPIIRTALEQHYQLVTLRRRYNWWLLWNLVDVLVFAGVPLLAGYALAMRKSIRQPATALAGLAGGVLLLLFVLNISGSTRGEVGRLWLFLMLPMAVVAAWGMSSTLKSKRSWLLLLGLELAVAVSLGLAWRPVRAVAVVAQQPEMPAVSADLQPVNVRLGEQVTLTGFQIEQGAAAIQLTLVWESDGPTARPYTVFNHLVDSAGIPVAQADNWPLAGAWPPTCWEAGMEIVDRYTVPLPSDLPAGEYRLLTGMYDASSEARLRAADGRDAIELTTVAVSTE
jgi:hypothetical protein